MNALAWNGYEERRKSQTKYTFIPDFRKQPWHVFGVEWRPDGYTFDVDGRPTWETTVASTHAEQEIVRSTEIGKWAGDIAKSKLPQQASFDYVRVWQRAQDMAVP